MMRLYLLVAIAIQYFACTPRDNVKQEAASMTSEQTNEVYPDAPSIFGDTLPIDRSIDYLTGHFDPTQREEFTPIDTLLADRAGLWLRKDAYVAFEHMYEAAMAEGIKLIIRSATRNFDTQKSIWERKWTGKTTLSSGISAPDIVDPVQRALAILQYSSMPGTSRHHWGTDIDLNAFNNDYFASGEGLKIYQWLRQHAADFGFCQPYTAKGPRRPEGYEEEKWHWSYLPVSAVLLHEARMHLQDASISGFDGAQTAPVIGVVEKYVMGIDTLCQPNYKGQ